MRVLVCGSRHWLQDRENVEFILEMINRQYAITTVIAGECRGPDTYAKDWALKRKVEYLGFPANWNKYGKSAGPKRNLQMLVEGDPDLVVAFTDDLAASNGTRNMVTIAQNKGVTCEIFSHHDINLIRNT